MGLNPYRHFNNNVPIANGRYRMLLHHLESYPKYPRTILFHDRPNFGLFSCASQVQLDAQKDTLVETLNTFTRLEPVKALLFANSPWEDFLCSRDYFWKHSMHGVNPHNVDIYDKKLTSVDEVVAYRTSGRTTSTANTTTSMRGGSTRSASSPSGRIFSTCAPSSSTTSRSAAPSSSAAPVSSRCGTS